MNQHPNYVLFLNALGYKYACTKKKTYDPRIRKSFKIKERETGFEPDLEHRLSDNESNTWEDIEPPVSAPTSALGAENAENQPSRDKELQAVLDAWPKLPGAVRAGIVAMVNASNENKSEWLLLPSSCHDES